MFATRRVSFTRPKPAGKKPATIAAAAAGKLWPSPSPACFDDGEITRARASELARMVLRDNARALYKLK